MTTQSFHPTSVKPSSNLFLHLAYLASLFFLATQHLFAMQNKALASSLMVTSLIIAMAIRPWLASAPILTLGRFKYGSLLIYTLTQLIGNLHPSLYIAPQHPLAQITFVLAVVFNGIIESTPKPQDYTNKLKQWLLFPEILGIALTSILISQPCSVILWQPLLLACLISQIYALIYQPNHVQTIKKIDFKHIKQSSFLKYLGLINFQFEFFLLLLSLYSTHHWLLWVGLLLGSFAACYRNRKKQAFTCYPLFILYLSKCTLIALAWTLSHQLHPVALSLITLTWGYISSLVWQTHQMQNQHQQKNQGLPGLTLQCLLGYSMASVTLSLWPTVFGISITLLIINGLLSLATHQYQPMSTVHMIFKSVFYRLTHTLFKLEIIGESYLQTPKNTPIITIGNHTSLFDVPIIGSHFYEKLLYPIYPLWLNIGPLKPLLNLLGDVFPMEPTDSKSLVNLIKAIKQGRRCVIYPEGALTFTGNLMKIYDGTATMIDQSKAGVQSFVINGANQFPTSLNDYKSQIRWFSSARIAISPLEHWSTGPLKGRNKRQYLTRLVFGQLTQTYLESFGEVFLTQALIESAKKFNKKTIIVTEHHWKNRLSYTTLINQADHLCAHLLKRAQHTEIIGLVIPSNCQLLIALFACFSAHRCAATIDPNHLTSRETLIEALKVRQSHTAIITQSLHQSLDLANHPLPDIQVLVIEDLLAKPAPWFTIKPPKQSPKKQPALLYINDKQTPLVYTHDAVHKQIHQLALVCDHRGYETLYNTLGLHDYYGLIMGCLCPLMHGIRHFIQDGELSPSVLMDNLYMTKTQILVTRTHHLEATENHCGGFDSNDVHKVFYPHEPLKTSAKLAWEIQAKCYLYSSLTPEFQGPILAQQSPYYNSTSSLGQCLPGTTVNGKQLNHPKPESTTVDRIQGPQTPLTSSMLPNQSHVQSNWHDDLTKKVYIVDYQLDYMGYLTQTAAD